jgi:hypothetical protein
MAHFAEIDDLNIVQRVIVIDNSVILDDEGNESEEIGKTFCSNLLSGNWLQTSYHGNIRKNYAGIGHTYDATRDAFIAPEPEDAIGFDEETCQWIVPEKDFDETPPE